jgi:hypothetical protein
MQAGRAAFIEERECHACFRTVAHAGAAVHLRQDGTVGNLARVLLLLIRVLACPG